MATLTRWDPFREMTTMRNMMNRLFDDEMMSSRMLGDQASSMALPLDVSENQNAYVVKASIPGIDPNDVEITLHDNLLTIRGETKQENEQENDQYHLRERRFGSFMRSISLPAAVNSDAVEASCANGVLTLTIPKSEESKPRRISVGSGSRTIDSYATSGQINTGQGNGGRSSTGQMNKTQGASGQMNPGPQKSSRAGGKAAGQSATGQSSQPQSGDTMGSMSGMEGNERSR